MPWFGSTLAYLNSSQSKVASTSFNSSIPSGRVKIINGDFTKNSLHLKKRPHRKITNMFLTRETDHMYDLSVLQRQRHR